VSCSKERELGLVILTVVGVIASLLVLEGGLSVSQAAVAKPPTLNSLPQGCSKPADGYLVLMTNYGYNDSMLKGPTLSWPVIKVQQNTTVNITVCNADPSEAHGFQISNYYDSKIVSVVPGVVIHVSFRATQVGSFRIYCAIFCAIHPFMVNGELLVTS
jgi:FtsP/CotA-like multicopper oxidase with cupredoxin domain